MSNPIPIEDVTRLLDDEDISKRLAAVESVADQYQGKAFNKEQKALADQIFRVLMHDAETEVRRALSESLKEINTVPKDIIMQLVDDIDEVAVPVLETSAVLTDEDLVNIIKNSASSEKFMAISNRPEVSEDVSEALVDTGDKKVTKNMLQRAAVRFSEMGLSKVFEKHGEDEDIVKTMATRDALPVNVAEKMISSIGGALQEELVSKYGHLIPNINEVVSKSQEAATLKFMGVDSTDKEIRNMVEGLEKTSEIAHEIYTRDAEMTEEMVKLESSGRLTPISALCMGNLSLFEISLSRITNIPVANVRKLLQDDSWRGLEALYNRAKLPPTLYEAVKIVIKVVREMDEEAKENSAMKKTANTLITRILKRAEDESGEVENLSYFISMIHQHAKLMPKDN